MSQVFARRMAHDVVQSRVPPSELMSDYRSRLALEQFRAEELRQQERAEQSSTLNTPETRIRAWEKVHGVRLPASPAHPVLESVSTSTGLSLEQVHAEQSRRSAVPC
jgi:hypothetical protein